MPKSSMNVAMFPGTFDPITYGHLDIIERASLMYERFVVAIGDNPEKESLFTAQERQAMIEAHLPDPPKVEVLYYQGLTVRFAREIGVGVIIRGIRDTVDLHAELEIANTNLMISGIETVFLLASSQHAMTSSTLIKQIVQIGGYDRNRLSRLVPLDVAEKLESRLHGG